MPLVHRVYSHARDRGTVGDSGLCCVRVTSSLLDRQTDRLAENNAGGITHYPLFTFELQMMDDYVHAGTLPLPRTHDAKKKYYAAYQVGTLVGC